MNARAVRLLLLVVPVLTSGAAQPQMLPAGTEVKLSFAQSLSSNHAVEGERVELRVAEDVRCGETVVIRAGSRVLGTVTVGKKKEKYGFAPGLAITLDYIVTPERRIPLTGRQEWTRKGDTGSDIASATFFGVGGYLMSRGRRVARVEEGTIVTAFTAENVPLVVAPCKPVPCK
ncbi:MAG TPA: hypothetical protein VFJ02_02435 [Vicinamibacterales bacterium]|nr:hypothetical protein [Vicinamibacterales bacterium]